MEVDRIDAAILAEELTEIYSTPTPKGWPKPKKVIDFVFDWLMIFYNSWGLVFILEV